MINIKSLDEILNEMHTKTESGKHLGLTCIDAMAIQKLIEALRKCREQRDYCYVVNDWMGCSESADTKLVEILKGRSE